jgi:cell division protein FtsA
VSPRFQILRRRDDYYKHFSALDIGTEMVKVVVVRRDGPEATVLGVGRVRQAEGAMKGGAIADVEAVIDACNQGLEAAEDMAAVVPGQVAVGIAGELVKGFASAISYPRDHPDVKVRDVELRSLLELVQKRALREAQQLLELERAYGDLEARLVHAAITSVKMDGYPVISPIGFQGRNLEVTVFNTFAPATQVEALETTLRELDLELLSIVAQPYAMARACASDEIWEQGGIFVDIGGATTDVALIRNGGVEATRMFNLGGRTITRHLAAAMGLTMEEAEARKVRYTEGLLSTSQESEVGQIVASNVDVLLQGLNLCLKEAAQGEALPPRVLVCGGGSLLSEVMDALTRGGWIEGLPFPRQPNVSQLMPNDVHGLMDATGQLTSAQDVAPLALVSHALRSEAEQRGTVQTVMRGVLDELKV